MIHGTESAYSRHGCRCDVCRQGRYRRAKAYRTGLRDPLVDPVEARQHLDALAGEGFGYQAMLALSGWKGQGRALTSRRMHASFRDAILALTRNRLLAELPDTAWVPALGAKRRIAALRAIGWPMRTITPGSVLARNVMRPRSPLVTAASHRLIAARFDQLCMTAGPYRRVGDVTPLMWDDIDDPAETPWTRPDFRIRSMVDPEDVDLLLTAGLDGDQIASRLGVSYEAVVQQLHRTGQETLRIRVMRTRRAS